MAPVGRPSEKHVWSRTVHAAFAEVDGEEERHAGAEGSDTRYSEKKLKKKLNRLHLKCQRMKGPQKFPKMEHCRNSVNTEILDCGPDQ